MNSKYENKFDNDYNYKIFLIYINLYCHSKNIENNLSRPVQIKEEYFLINASWLDEFKQRFNYRDLEQYLDSTFNYAELNNLESKEYLDYLYEKYYLGKEKIDKINFDQINKIHNKKILFKISIDNDNITYYKNFAIINQKTFEDLKSNSFYFDEKPKTDIFLGINNLIMNVGPLGLECIFCNDYDSFSDEFLIYYKNKEYRDDAIKVISNNGLKYYFIKNKIDNNKCEEQYIYSSKSNELIATVYNLDRNEKEIIKNNINTQVNNIWKEASNSLKKNDNIESGELSAANQIRSQINKYGYITSISQISKIATSTKHETILFNQFNPNRKIGLINLSNSCYINAVLQCLFHIPELVKYFFKNVPFESYKKPLSYALNFFVEALYKPLNYNDNISKYDPKFICDIIFALNKNFSPYKPNDAKDFLIFLIDQLHRELNKTDPSKNNNYFNIIQKNDPLGQFINYFVYNYRSIISDLFNWTNQVKRTCECHTEIISFQTFPYLILDLENTRIDKYKKRKQEELSKMENTTKIKNEWFEYYHQKENVPIDLIECIQYYYFKKNEFTYFCPFCKKNCKQSSTNRIYTSPNIFIFILNRGKNNIHSVKMNYPPELDITEYTISPVSPNKYELIGVITHLGLSGPGGHFVAYSKSPIDKKWYFYNDEKVSEANNFKIHNDGIAYILFYRKKE